MPATIGIYAIENTETGRLYIGASQDVEFQMHTHRSALKNGKHRNRFLQEQWDSFGSDAFRFRVITEHPDRDTTFYAERRLIRRAIRKRAKLYNRTDALYVRLAPNERAHQRNPDEPIVRSVNTTVGF